jgi:two-component system, chemotaxis family, chemotaxis protein CheY
MAAKALVLDDSRAMRGVLSKILVRLGFEIVQAGNGVEALAVMDREGAEIELILADWNMPEMNGLEFVKALRTQVKFAATPVIMVTTETNVDQMLEALSAGANEYIMKPFTAEMVEAKLLLVQASRSEAANFETGHRGTSN